MLNTGGGTVTGYGLAAAQLLRLKEAGLHLTICIEQVAASGGYMMACTADTIVASPFAVVGSIGVITEQPNAYAAAMPMHAALIQQPQHVLSRERPRLAMATWRAHA